ncbi:MAG: hypothetical protein KKA60_13830 [Proteobacteria bacterium]|nr:hypothetical protein [Pseudomonadota bacterium]
MLTEKEERFLKMRRSMNRAWPWLGSFLLVFVAGAWLWLARFSPLMFNPFNLVERLGAGDVDPATLSLLAAMGSLAFVTIGFLLFCVVLLLFGSMATEKKLLRIIDQTQNRPCEPHGGLQ